MPKKTPPQQPPQQQILHLHLISDATGETTHHLARAALARFSHVTVTEHIWTLVRSHDHLSSVCDGIARHGGVVFFSIAEQGLRKSLEDFCAKHNIIAIGVLDHVLHSLAKVLGPPDTAKIGGQHRMDEAYFNRIDALDFTIRHDDGQALATVGEADILLVGVSRTSKTPTAIYLAHRGYKVANYPLVPGVKMPLDEIPSKGLFVVGLTKDSNRLVEIRRNRLISMNEMNSTDYADPEKIRAEIASARKLFTAQNWPVINVSRRSVEETAATIINLYQLWSSGQHNEPQGNQPHAIKEDC